jgi:serine/threonine protein kinase
MPFAHEFIGMVYILYRGYLAPEFTSCEITYQFDLYSLGVIIIEILTGKKGYKAVEDVRTLYVTFLR